MTGAGVAVYVSAGSNIEPARHLRDACRRLIDTVGPIETSPVYQTEAVGFDGDDFLNLVVAFRTELSAESVDDVLGQIELAEGRTRDGSSFSARTMDLDLLLYGDAVISTPELTIPRADILRYAFVLRPLVDLAPDLRHPENGRTMRELWSEFDKAAQPIEQLEQPLL